MEKCGLICIEPPISYILTTKNSLVKNISGCETVTNAFHILVTSYYEMVSLSREFMI